MTGTPRETRRDIATCPFATYHASGEPLLVGDDTREARAVVYRHPPVSPAAVLVEQAPESVTGWSLRDAEAPETAMSPRPEIGFAPRWWAAA